MQDSKFINNRLKSSSSSSLHKSLIDADGIESEVDETEPTGISEKSLTSDGNDKESLKTEASPEVEEKETLHMISLFFEEPAPLKGEVFRTPCQLISLVRTVPGWFAITQTAIHFLQNHAKPIESEISTSVNGKCGVI